MHSFPHAVSTKRYNYLGRRSPRPYKGISIPESGKFLFVGSRIMDFGIRDTAQRIRNPSSTDKVRNSVPGIQNSRSGIQNPRLSWIPLNGTSQLRTRVSDCGICSRCLIIIKMLCSDLRIQGKRFVTFPEKISISSWSCRFEESHREMYQNEN